MKPLRLVGLMVWLVVAVVVFGGVASTANAEDLRRIVVFWAGTPVQVQLDVVALSGSRVLHILSLINALAIELPALDPLAALVYLGAQPTVLRIDGDPPIKAQGEGGDGVITPAAAPAKEFYPWGIDRIGADEVQKQTGLTGDGVKVALLDTGIDRTHPELKANIIGGYNAMADQDPNNWQDDNGHGTHVAGTLAARLNKKGVIGAAPKLQIYVFKTLDKYGKGTTSDVINALQRVPSDIRIITMSAGTDLVWPSFEEAIYALYQAGKLMVFSAGNRCAGTGAQGEGGDATCDSTATDIKFPARYPWVIAVGASDENEQVPSFSRSGLEMADHGVVAPGVNIFSLNLGGGYGLMNGTSASTPHVTGAVALALQLQAGLSYEEMLAHLQATAQNLGYPPEQQGAGRMNTWKLVNRLKQR